MSFLIEIPKRSKVCVEGQEPFSPDTEYYSLLRQENGILQRFDYCERCWKRLELKEKTYWKGRIPAEHWSDQPAQSRDELVLNCLKEMLAQTGQEEREEAFVLGLYLARKKLLTFRQQLKHNDGSIFLLYELLETEEILSIPDIRLAGLNIKHIQRRIATKLSPGLRSP